MAQYKANATNSRNFSLTADNVNVGELKYNSWYSFSAEIELDDHSVYRLEPKGSWDSRVELLQNGKVLLSFKMGWKGIIIKTHFKDSEKEYLLQLKGLLSSTYVLVDTHEKVVLEADADFKWTKLDFGYIITTSPEFDDFENKALILLTILHSINYNMAVSSGTV